MLTFLPPDILHSAFDGGLGRDDLSWRARSATPARARVAITALPTMIGLRMLYPPRGNFITGTEWNGRIRCLSAIRRTKFAFTKCTAYSKVTSRQYSDCFTVLFVLC